MTRGEQQRKSNELIGETNVVGACLLSACHEIAICLRTHKHCSKAIFGDRDGEDYRKGSDDDMVHRLSEEERHRILLTCNQPD